MTDQSYDDIDNVDAEQPDDTLEQELADALSDLGAASLMEADRESPGTASAEGVRKGTVIAIHGDDIFVDMGGKSQGLLSATQFEDEPLPEEGDVIEVTVEGYDRADGLLLLSRKGAVLAATWANIDEGAVVEGRVTGHNKGGLELDVNGIKAFMPVSHIELARVEELAPYVNQRLTCQVIEVRPEEKTLVVSRRAVLEVELAEAREQTWQNLAEGKVVTGVVRSIMPYGAFVALGHDIDGLLHVSEMSHSRVEKPEDVVHEGQKLQVQIIKIDQEERRIGLSLKSVLADPWDEIETKWPVDAIVTGRVTKLMDFGAFCELEPGIEGLIPISEMSFAKRINHPREVVSEGEVVKVRVLSIDRDRKRIALSLKRVEDDPWLGASARWPEGSVVEGKVTRLADFGAFVELTAGVESLIHISELADTHVRAPSDVVKVGDTVTAKVLDVDEDRRRMSLSIKKLKEDPNFTGEASATEPGARPTGRSARDYILGENAKTGGGLFDGTALGASGQSPSPTPQSPKKKEKKRKGGLDW